MFDDYKAEYVAVARNPERGNFVVMPEHSARKRYSDGWFRSDILERLLSGSLFTTMGVTWFCAVALTWFVRFQDVTPTAWNLLSTTLPGVILLLAALIFARRIHRGWKTTDMRKGARSEARIGHVIEYAISHETCAVAHNVIGIAKKADIDHLVATPRGLWMIETKSKRHSDTEDSKLNALAAQVKDVRNWALPGTATSGCLVYVEDAGSANDSELRVNGESIQKLANQKSVAKILRTEVQEEGGSISHAKKYGV